jgi:hypothetical protein
MLSLAACAAPSPPVDPRVDGRNPDTEETTMPTAPVSARATPASRPLPPGRFVTLADDGRVLTMQVGETRELRTRDALAPEPTVEGDAIEAIGIDNVQAGNGRSWELRAVRPGRSRIAVAGAEPFAVTIEVAPAR